MCGILGILSKNHTKHIEAANALMQHRGPDDSGIFIEDNIALAHQRLSILDLSPAGSQPMHSEDGMLTIVFNGEIYNHLEIRAMLKGSHTFRSSSSDTETLLYAYKELGTKLFEKLNGIFAFAIYDKNKGQIVLCRDQFGIKPLYYYKKGEDFFFGSEIKSFLKIPEWDKSIDHSALVNYLHYLYCPGEQTPFKHIKKMLPGHFVILDIVNPSEFHLKQYYEIPFNGNYESFSESEWIAKIDVAFTKAVERQLLSDVPIGFFLSGGLDSSIIVAKARELTGRRLQCYTIDTDLEDNDKDGFRNDLHYAKKVAKYLDVDLEIVPGRIDIVNDFDKMIWHLDEPQADAAPLNVLNICKIARQMGNVVMMGGTAGDDLFSGYRRHQAVSFERYFKWTPNILGKGINALVNQFSSNNATIRRVQKLSKGIDKRVLERLMGYYEWLPLEINKSLFSSEIISDINGYNPSHILRESLSAIPNEKENLNKLLFWDMKYFLTDHNLNYTDKLSMAVGVEARVPFLDVDLVALSTKIPVGMKLKGKETKYILKKMAEKYLPNDVIYRPKTGFGAPVRKWITNDLDDMINDRLSPKRVEERGIFNSKRVSKLIRDNKKGEIDASYPIWGLLAIESWMQQFVD